MKENTEPIQIDEIYKSLNLVKNKNGDAAELLDNIFKEIKEELESEGSEVYKRMLKYIFEIRITKELECENNNKRKIKDMEEFGLKIYQKENIQEAKKEYFAPENLEEYLNH